ncbi:kynureninase [Nisaea acidiphila]|uniref:Kynureninase n=1 Tax=Nisaea acidiphila TaxID=1862145 RepID=A0A9J7AUA0_9PROT|nr:kynureninase [Nisaea acidiphila]UUX49892.1 kynureninase [Nisaea acidiphila]
MTALDRDALAARDAADPLARFRNDFELPDGVIYLDGNSLGPLPRVVRERVAACVTEEWGTGLIRSWNSAGWIDLPTKAGGKISALIGAEPESVVATDSTSVNLFKVLAAALALRPDRKVIVSEKSNFPTDLYMVEGLTELFGKGHELRLIEDPSKLPEALGKDVAAVMLTHVNYRSGYMHDMAAVTKSGHEAGALAIWDLAHSAGAVPVDLAGAGADFAVGCGYKYLNGGPGAPAFAYVAPRHQEAARQPLTGWFSHKAPFAFDHRFEATDGIKRFLCGTPPVLAMTALDAALDLWSEVDMAALREKSVALTECFIELVESRCAGLGLTLASPREAAQRGSQVSFAHESGYPVMQALIARGVIGDFRAPDLLRFGFTPLYTRFADVWDAVTHLEDILRTRCWDRPEFHARAAVT